MVQSIYNILLNWCLGNNTETASVIANYYKGKTNQWEQKKKSVVASSLGWGWGWLKRGMRDIFGKMEMCSTFVVTVVTQVHTFVKAPRPVQLKWMHFIVYKWYLNKADLFERIRIGNIISVCCSLIRKVIYYITNPNVLFLFSFVEYLKFTFHHLLRWLRFTQESIWVSEGNVLHTGWV